MKKINHSILRGFNALIVLVLGIFGFSCDKHSTKETPVEYGTPTADFIIKGKVVAKSTQIPIKNIEVNFLRNDGGGVLTGEQGDFTLPTFYYYPDDNVPIIAADIDGAENGSYQTDTIYVDVNDAEQTKKGDNKWYRGEFTKSVTVELEEVNN